MMMMMMILLLSTDIASTNVAGTHLLLFERNPNTPSIVLLEQGFFGNVAACEHATLHRRRRQFTLLRKSNL